MFDTFLVSYVVSILKQIFTFFGGLKWRGSIINNLLHQLLYPMSYVRGVFIYLLVKRGIGT